jgi:hypothetical protein
MRLATLLHTPSPLHAFAVGAERLSYGRLSRRRDSLERVEAQDLSQGWVQLGPVGLLQADRQVLADGLASLVSRLEKTPQRASLVVPNAWVRSVVVDVESLPRQRQEAEDVVRWRIKKLLPCRPEDVRLDFARSDDNGRLLVVIALDRPLAAIEEAFAATGVALGRLEPSVLALTALLPSTLQPTLLLAVEDHGIGLVLVARGRIVLVRHKGLPVGGDQVEPFVLRELGRTLAHLRDSERESESLNVWVAAPPQPLADLLAHWATGEAGVAIHQLSAPPTSVPDAAQVDGLTMWSLLATAWQGEA